MASSRSSVDSEKRRHRRLALEQRVAVHVPCWLALSAVCVDVSEGGVRVRLRDKVKPGDRIMFAADLPDRGRVQVAGEVKRVRRIDADCYEVGLSWVGPPEVPSQLFMAMVGQRGNG